MGLKEMLQVWVDHRRVVIRRRSEFRRKKALERLHLVEGLLLAMVDIDEVIQVIRSSDDAEAAKTKLIAVFDLDEIQAQYILDSATAPSDQDEPHRTWKRSVMI